MNEDEDQADNPDPVQGLMRHVRFARVRSPRFETTSIVVREAEFFTPSQRRIIEADLLKRVPAADRVTFFDGDGNVLERTLFTPQHPRTRSWSPNQIASLKQPKPR